MGFPILNRVHLFTLFQKTVRATSRLCLILIVVSVSVSICCCRAHASITVHVDENVGGFVSNSASNTPSFLSAIGTPDEFISFSYDKDGNLVGSGDVDGSIFSDNVVFASGNSALVNSAGSGSGSEIGPAGGYTGILKIDFLAAGQTASIVGFGPVEFGVIEQVRVFDQFNSLVLTRGGVSNNTWDFLGLEATNGDAIGRVELEGTFFAIQDIQFNLAQASVVPETTSILAWTMVLGGIGLIAYQRNMFSDTPGV